MSEHATLNDRLDTLEDKLDQVVTQTTLTNGRTSKLESIVVGDPGRLLPNGEPDRGLQGQVHDNQRVLDTITTLIKVGKRVSIALGVTALGLLGNLAAGLF